MSLRERAVTCNSLICLLKALENRVSTVELRNETSVIGKVELVDAYMNLHMKDVMFISPDGSEKRFNTFFIQGRQVRYVHIPDDIDISGAIQNQLSTIRKSSLCKQPQREKKKKKSKFPQNDTADVETANTSETVT